MREIKFRGKSIKTQGANPRTGEWIYGCLTLYPVPQIHDLEEEFDVDPETVGQFAVLKDKNGKEIYEGDVVEKIDIYSEDNSREGVGVVKYDPEHIEFIFSQISGDDYAFYMPDGNNWSKDELAVIGNIHENPELLEVE